jgi:hypothetical protein
MAQFPTDFSEYTGGPPPSSGTPPSDWTLQWGLSSTWQVQTETNEVSGGPNKLHKIAAGTGGNNLLRWDDVGQEADDVEVLCVLTSPTFVAMRVQNDNANADGVLVSIDPTLDQIGLTSFLNGSSGGFGALQTAAVTNAPGDNVAIRMRCDGARVRARAWLIGDPEPSSWQIDYNSLSGDLLNAGWVGVYVFSNTETDVWYFAAGTDGDPAPGFDQPDQPYIEDVQQTRFLTAGYLKTVNVTLTGSPYSGPGSIAGAEWEFTDDGGTFTVSSLDETLAVTAMRIATANAVRVRYESPTAVFSNWSDYFYFTTLAYPPEAFYSVFPNTTDGMRIRGTTWGTQNPHRLYSAATGAGLTADNFESVGTLVDEFDLTYDDDGAPIFDVVDFPAMPGRDDLCFVLAGFDPGENGSGGYIGAEPFCFASAQPGLYGCFDFDSVLMDTLWNPDFGLAPSGPGIDCVGQCIFAVGPPTANGQNPAYYSQFPAVWALRRNSVGQDLPGAASQRMGAVVKPGTGGGIWFYPAYGAEFSQFGVGALVSENPSGGVYGVLAFLGTGVLEHFGCCCEWGKPAGQQSLHVVVYAPGATYTFNEAIPVNEWVRTTHFCGGQFPECVCPCSNNPPSSGISVVVTAIQRLDLDASGRTYTIRATAGDSAEIDEQITLPAPLPCGHPALMTLTAGAGAWWAEPTAIDLARGGCGVASVAATSPAINEPDLDVLVDCTTVRIMGGTYSHVGACDFAYMLVEFEEWDGASWIPRSDLNVATDVTLHNIENFPAGFFRTRITYGDECSPPNESPPSDWLEFGVLEAAVVFWGGWQPEEAFQQ